MNTASLRRREYSKKEEGIKLPAGYTLGSYWNLISHTFVELGVIPPFDFEVGVEPSELSSNNGYFIIGAPAGAYYKINKDGYAATKGDGAVSESMHFSVNTYALVTGHMIGNSSPENVQDYTYFVNGVNTGVMPSDTSAVAVNFMAGTKFAYAFKGKFYPLKIWKDGELVHHYVPCKDGNGTGYMYDVIDKQFITPTKGTFNVV